MPERSVRFAVKADTSASPEQVIAIAGKDFSPRRAEIWPNVHPARLTVHDQSEHHCEVTEGGTGPARFIWERSRYEWPQPDVVTGTVVDSNALLPGSTFELRAEPSGDGSTVEMILDRRFRSSGWGRIGHLLNRLGGERLFASMLRDALKHVERSERRA